RRLPCHMLGGGQIELVRHHGIPSRVFVHTVVDDESVRHEVVIRPVHRDVVRHFLPGELDVRDARECPHELRRPGAPLLGRPRCPYTIIPELVELSEFERRKELQLEVVMMDTRMAWTAKADEIVEVTTPRGVVPDGIDVMSIELPTVRADRATILVFRMDARRVFDCPAADVRPLGRDATFPEVGSHATSRRSDDPQVVVGKNTPVPDRALRSALRVPRKAASLGARVLKTEAPQIL